MKMQVIIEKDERGYSVYSDGLKCGIIIGDGKSVAKAKEDFMNTLEEVRSTYPARGMEIPKELVNPEFKFKYDVASVFDDLDFINLTKFAELSGFNSSLLRHYKRGDFAISGKQASKIERALHDIGRRLVAISVF